MKNYYEDYWKKDHGKRFDFDIKWEKLRRYIPLEKGVVIADLGCGDGVIINEIRAVNPSAGLIGLDVSGEALQAARAACPQGQFHKIEDGGPFPLADNSVDFIFSSEVIEHIYDTQNAFNEIRRVLRPGGKVLLTTPYHGFVKNLLLVLFSFDEHFSPTGPHIRFFTKRSLGALLSSSGMDVIAWDHYGRFFPVPFSMVALARKRG
jgi:SAM-dependent methyltransferase